MKRFKLIICVFMVISMLTACSSNNIPLTDKESDAIAQYCAHLILKYDKNKTQNRKLLDVKELQDIYKEKKAEEEKSQEVGTATVIPTKPADEGGVSPTPTPKDDKAETTKAPAPTEQEQKDTVKSLTKLYSLSHFTIDYISYGLSDVYSENEYSSFSAKEGEKILAVELKITNNSSEKKKFISSEYPINYTLYCDNGDIIVPSVSMLSNDIQFLDDSIDPGKSFNAVVLFIIYENRNEKGFVLRGTNSATEKICEITLN
ncbi:MAG: DUF4352 domain-containing protein [Lachnospiraceae bacterium]|nr:DUF4352 domain-containing protein [Lachnospiraceae bacterium]